MPPLRYVHETANPVPPTVTPLPVTFRPSADIVTFKVPAAPEHAPVPW